MIHKIEGIYQGAQQKLSTYDITFPKHDDKMPMVIFCHGFKGFKDWGGFNYIADYLAQAGIACCKINFSHNGTTVEDPNNFNDLDSFSKNTLYFEIEDIAAIEKHLLSLTTPRIDAEKLFIIGHSKGGVAALLHQCHFNTSIKAVITWASPFNFFRFWSNQFIQEWREKGIQYIVNARTRQKMPLALDILIDYENRKDFYDLEKVLPDQNFPLLIIHGGKDESVPVDQAYSIQKNRSSAQMVVIEDGNHTFGMTHPIINTPPDCLLMLLKHSLEFIRPLT